MAVTKILYLDLQDQNVTPVVRVSRYDSGLRAFEFHLMDGSEIFTIPSNVSITLRGTKPDKNGFSYACTFTQSTGIVRANLTEQMTAVVGCVFCQIVIVDTNRNRIASFCFYLIVEKSATDENTIYSDSDLAYVEEAMNAIQSITAANNLLQFVNYSSGTIYLKKVNFNN